LTGPIICFTAAAAPSSRSPSMRRTHSYVLLLFLCPTAESLAVPQTATPATEPKKGDDPGLVEVRLADGSAVRMTLIQTHIDVATRYGKLSVPVTDLKKIEFGFRYPDGAKEKIENAVVNLGSPHFKVREAAAAELFGYKELCYPALKSALKAADAEVVKRAEEIIKKLEEKIPAERLKINENDYVHTHEFTIAGKIESATLQARSPYFGVVQVQLAEARSLRALRVVGDIELTLESRYASHNEWLEIEVDVAADDPIEIKATGQIQLRPGQGFESTPNGNENYNNGNYKPGQLLGRVGKFGKTFIVGEAYKGAPGEAGKLYLRIHPSPWGNQVTGSYSVKVTPGGSVEGRTPLMSAKDDPKAKAPDVKVPEIKRPE
jgi:hypothetical protein